MKRFKKYYPEIVCLLLGIVFVVAFFWTNFTLPAVNITPSVGTNDLTDLYYPFFHVIRESYSRGEIPLWYSNLSSGYPLLAGAVGTLYPVNIALSRFDTLTTLNLTIFISYYFLYAAAYLFLRRIGLPPRSSLFGALLTAFSGYSVTQLLHFDALVSFYLLLAQLFFLEYFLDKKSPVFIFLMSALMGLSFLGGHPQINLYTALFLFLYWLLRGGYFTRRGINYPSLIKTFFLPAAVYGLTALALGAAQLLPMAEFTLNSTRSSGLSGSAIDRFNFPLKDLLTFLSPFVNSSHEHTLAAFYTNGWPADERYVYMGLPALALAFFSLIKLKKWYTYRLVFAVLLSLSLLFMIGSQFSLGSFLNMPPFSFFRGSFKMSFAVGLSVAVLASFALSDLLAKLSKAKASSRFYTLAFAALVALTFIDLKYHAEKLHPPVNANAWYRTPESVLFLDANLKPHERVVGEQYFYPSVDIFLNQSDLWDNPQIFVNLRNLIPIFNNFLYNIPAPIGAANSAGLKVSRYNELESEIFFNGLIYDKESSATLSASSDFLLRLLGTRYFLSVTALKHPNFQKVHEVTFDTAQNSLKIYRFVESLPRALLVPKAQALPPEEIKTRLMEGSFDPRSVVLLEEEIHWGTKESFSSSVDIKRYSHHEVILHTQSSGDSFLFLSDTYYPGWKAYLDGRETKLYRANYAFRAVAVPQGEHNVALRYLPASFSLGLKISLFTAAFILAAIFLFSFSLLFRKRR